MSRIDEHLRFAATQLVWTIALLVAFTSPVFAQVRARIPGNTASTTMQPDSNLVPLPPSNYGGASLGQPTFDPYSTAPSNPGMGSIFGGTAAPPPASGQPAPPSWNGGLGTTPPALFPGGDPAYYPGEPTIVGVPQPLFEGVRLRHAWLAGEEGNEMDINETDVSAVFRWPNFLFTQQPLFVAPSFSLYLWDNPEPPDFPPTADLPGQAYGAYLDSFWRSDPTLALGVDLGVRVGVYSDFETLTTDSLRTMGQGILRYRVAPTVTLKGGVMYIDRPDIKLLPAGGVLWEPNPQTRFDIFFPQPKLAHYLTTVGSYDLWWYIMGEFGGNSWTVEREVDGMVDEIELSDIRLIAGLEFGGPELFREGRRLGFFEVGWVTEREGMYVRRPQDNFTISDTFMLRAGIGY